MGEMLSRYEWMIMEVILLGLLGWEWFSIRRTIRRDREARARKEAKEKEGLLF